MKKTTVEIAVGRLFKLLIDKKILSEKEVMEILKQEDNPLPTITVIDAFEEINGLQNRIIKIESGLNLLKFELKKKNLLDEKL